ncbi:675_t:CDS:2, partial [Paraglomus occultum]
GGCGGGQYGSLQYDGKPSVEQHGGDAWHSLLGHADAGQVTLEQGGCGGGQYGSLQYDDVGQPLGYCPQHGSSQHV